MLAEFRDGFTIVRNLQGLSKFKIIILSNTFALPFSLFIFGSGE